MPQDSSASNLMYILSRAGYTLHRVSSQVAGTLCFKERYIKTRDGRIRYRCRAFAAVAAISILSSIVPRVMSMNSVYFGSQTAMASVASTAGTASHGLDVAALSFSAQGQRDATSFSVQGKSGAFDTAMVVRPAKPPKLVATDRQIDIQSGDTLVGSLQNAGVDAQLAFDIVKAVSSQYDPRLIRPGQDIRVKLVPEKGRLQFASMELVSDPIRTVVVKRSKKGDLETSVAEKEILPQMFAVKADVKNSLYGSAAKSGVPEPIIAQAIKVLSWSVDFQRDIKSGDTFELLYDVYMTDDGQYVRSGEPYYVKLIQAKKEVAFYRFEQDNGTTDYFRADGHSAKKGLLTTPIDGARVSSGFGMRRHPVLGYSKMHKGMDFAAPTGTPIYAAGDGEVQRAGRFSSYGNYVRVNHNSKLATAYAHMSRIAKGIKPGTHVKQGEVIGYVGTTGRSTGPHLHYEVLVNNSQVSPTSVKVPTGKVLAGAELKRFKNEVGDYEKQFKKLVNGLKFASRDTDTETVYR
ncbi:MAG: peptidoglycan DD-metalloendopeptidase family protein [Pseudobdellovibrionaceae bacterium]